MTDELIERLRDQAESERSQFSHLYPLKPGALEDEAAALIEQQAARIAELESAQSSQQGAETPYCQACGDGITAHDPGVCGNCFAIKYRDDAEDARRYRWLKAWDKLDGWTDEAIDRQAAIDAALSQMQEPGGEG